MCRKELNIVFIIIIILHSSCQRYRLYDTGPAEGTYEIATSKLVKSVRLNNVLDEPVAINRITIHYRKGEENRKFRANMKYNGRDSILLSIRTIAGIEAARVLIDKDAIKISDKINKVYYLGKTDRIGRRYGVEFAFINMLFGDIAKLKNGEKSTQCIEGIAKIREEEEGNTLEYTIDCNIKKLKAVEGRIGYEGEKIQGIFNEYRYENGFLYPGKIEWRMEGEGALINLEMNNVKSLERKNLIFRVNHDYEVKIIR